MTVDDIDISIFTRNRSIYLKQAIQSLLGQTTKINQLNVYANECGDDTRKIINELHDSRIKYIETFGEFGNFETMKNNVSKKYCMIFHDDDILHPQYLQNVISALNESDNISLVTTAYTRFIDNNVPDLKPILDYKYLVFKQHLPDFARYMMMFQQVSFAPSIYRTVDFYKYTFDFNRYGKFADWPMIASFARVGNVIVLCDDNAYLYRVHTLSDSNNKKTTPTVQQIINWSLFFLHEGKFLEKDYINIYTQYCTHFLYGKYKDLISDEDRKRYSFYDVIQQMIDSDPYLNQYTVVNNYGINVNDKVIAFRKLILDSAIKNM